jgi:hypothetical protein
MNETIDTAGETAGLATLLVLVGGFLKAIPNFPDKWIPSVLSLLGCAVAMGIGGFSVPNAVQGLSAGLTAVGANQLYRQHTATETKPTTTPTP